jgi:hypothetical protein
MQKIADSRSRRMKEYAKRKSGITRFFRVHKDMMPSDRMCHFKNLRILSSQTEILYHIIFKKSIPFLYFLQKSEKIFLFKIHEKRYDFP